MRTRLGLLLSGRSLPARVTGPALLAANLGATGTPGTAATGAQYGVAVVHGCWTGAIPATVVDEAVPVRGPEAPQPEQDRGPRAG
ncbi:hypothetical protein QFZ71_002256 [Streptomyces sp. V2I9]|nr:hypothetical protein [Streptomyces sp. V2I9]